MGIEYVQMPEALRRLHIAEPGRGLITALTASSNVRAHLELSSPKTSEDME